ncbi:MAG TPA: hypothetical protein VF796_30085 [Humisphaera sp.]
MAGNSVTARRFRIVAWTVAGVAVAGLVLGYLALQFAREHHRSRRATDVVGPNGAISFELLYAPNGDLTLARPGGGDAATARDYYGSLEVSRTTWLGPDHVELAMADGMVVTVHVGRSATYRSGEPATTASTTRRAKP